MKRISPQDVLAFEQWVQVRKILRPLFIHEKDRRRLSVGSHLTFLFENTRTLWYQIEEMLRTERISDSAAAQHELDTYNELIPEAGELPATLLIEFPDARERDLALRRLPGLERHVWLRLGDEKVGVKFDERQMSPEQISAVQFVRFPVGIDIDAEAFVKLADANQLAIVVDHPSLAAEAPISGALALALAEDLRAEAGD
jgi:hypothetical protein